MLEDRLNGLALMQIHQEIEPDVNQVLDKFSSANRRLDLIWFYMYSLIFMQLLFQFKQYNRLSSIPTFPT